MSSAAVALPLADRQPAQLVDNPYIAYAYSYPHKSAYGPLAPPVPLAALWQAEDRHALFLYLHVPFCEMRCGFCNLFARAGVDGAFVDVYLAALERQARVLAEATAGSRGIARMAVGGGTPTFLSPAQLERLFEVIQRCFVAHPSGIPTSVEVSPKTATAERLSVLRNHGVERISIGVQSFLDEETHAIGRPQTSSEVQTALERLRDFPVLNIDLIYGQAGQTVGSWLASVEAALKYRPDEIYLYPLYLRPTRVWEDAGTSSGVQGPLLGCSTGKPATGSCPRVINRSPCGFFKPAMLAPPGLSTAARPTAWSGWVAAQDRTRRSCTIPVASPSMRSASRLFWTNGWHKMKKRSATPPGAFDFRWTSAAAAS
jgi:hypothetical protein